MPNHIAAGLAKQGLFIAVTTIEVDGDYSRIQLLPYGEFRAADGRPTDAPHWIIADENGADVCELANGYKNKLVVDYEHQTLKSTENGQPAPAAGWMDYFYLTPKGVFAEVTWTDKAKEMIKNGEYKYVSPVFVYDKNGYVRKIINAALTNQPALDGMDEVVAACLGCESTVTELNNLLTKEEEKSMNPLLVALIAALSLKFDATEEEAITALNRLQTDAKANESTISNAVAALSLSNEETQPDPAQFVPIATVAEMQKQIAALTTQQAVKNADDMVQAALTAGKLLPAQKDWATAYCSKDPQGFAAYIDNAEAVVALTATQTGGKAPDAKDGGGVTLSAEQLAVCKSLDITEEAFKQSLSEA